MFSMRKGISEAELATILVNDAITAVDLDWEDFKRVYADDKPTDDLNGRLNIIAARLGSAIIVLRNVIEDGPRVVRIFDAMKNLVVNQLEKEIGMPSIWVRAIEYLQIIDKDSIEGRDIELKKSLLNNPSDNPMFELAFEGDMMQLVTKHINVQQYCQEFKIK